jgi:hypothetical protein
LAIGGSLESREFTRNQLATQRDPTEELARESLDDLVHPAASVLQQIEGIIGRTQSAQEEQGQSFLIVK